MTDKLAIDERIYPCRDCGVMRSKAEGGTVFTVCDACWDKHYAKDDKLAAAENQLAREQAERIETLESENARLLAELLGEQWKRGDIIADRDRLLARQGELEKDLERWIETAANFLTAGATAERERDEALANGVLSAHVCDIENDRAQLRTERDALLTRRDELLATIARISQSTPLDSEVAEALEQRGKLLAEVGTLRARCVEADANVAELIDSLNATTESLRRQGESCDMVLAAHEKLKLDYDKLAGACDVACGVMERQTAELAAARPIVEAAKAWRACDPCDRENCWFDQRLIDAIDAALAAESKEQGNG